MKLTKNDLKALMKECLREVLREEGVLTESVKKPLSNLLSSKPKQTIVANSQNKTKQQTHSSALSTINPNLSEAVMALSKQFQGPDAALMAEIFADTALTTLQEQNTGHQSFDVDGMGTYTKDISENPLVNDQSLKSLTQDGNVNRWAQIALAASKK